MQTQPGRTRALAISLVAITLLGDACIVLAQDETAPVQPQPNMPGPGGFGGGGFGGSFGGGGGFGRRFGRGDLFVWVNRLDTYITALAEMNLSPEFNLSPAQKRNVLAIRDGFKKVNDTWRANHAADIEDMQAEYRQMRRGGNYDEDRLRQIRDAARDLMAESPTGDEEIRQIQDLLTPDQNRLVDAKLEQQRIETESRRAEGFGGGGGWPDTPGMPGAPSGDPTDESPASPERHNDPSPAPDDRP